MELFPAVDIRGGQAVRLTQGDYDRMDVYSPDPRAVALSFQKQGAKNLHLVDLDGAKDGTLSNYQVIKSVVEATGLFVQVGGGIRDEARIRSYLDIGVGRVILGTVAVEDFDFLRRMVEAYGERIAVGVDARDEKVAVKGWRELTSINSLEFCEKLEKACVSTVIYTDIAKDGQMEGTNLEVYRTLVDRVGLNVIASGGVCSLEDIHSLARIPTYGAIVGKALYTGALKLTDALNAAGGEAE